MASELALQFTLSVGAWHSQGACEGAGTMLLMPQGRGHWTTPEVGGLVSTFRQVWRVFLCGLPRGAVPLPLGSASRPLGRKARHDTQCAKPLATPD